MKVFVSSDHHFYHKNIIKYANRPFDFESKTCVRDCAKFLIQNHNNVVSNDDIVILAGDLSANLRNNQSKFKELLKLLNGKKILVRGNHDYEPDEFYKEAGFIDVVDYLVFEPYFICHYPCFITKFSNKKEKEIFNILNQHKITHIIHGHIHNKDANYNDKYTRINVCVDYEPNKFTPIEITDLFLKEKIINKYK